MGTPRTIAITVAQTFSELADNASPPSVNDVRFLAKAFLALLDERGVSRQPVESKDPYQMRYDALKLSVEASAPCPGEDVIDVMNSAYMYLVFLRGNDDAGLIEKLTPCDAVQELILGEYFKTKE